jgi:alkylation response protein AidB-like acyl-CoA dehydrogenase
VPVLAQRAARTEAERAIPEQTIADFVDSGLLRAANPERYGGYGLDYDDVCALAMELGRGDGSAAWCFQVFASHNWMIGLAPEQAQEDYFADGPDVLASSGFTPTGATVEPVDGGWRVSGRWGFSSGCDHAQWALLAGIVPDERGYVLFVIPRSDWQIEDTWFVAGLKGTGSKDVVIDEPVLVPEHRYIPMHGAEVGPARELHNRPSYGVPIPSVMPFTLASPVLGMAQGAVDVFEDWMRGRVASFSGQKGSEQPSVWLRLSEAAAEVAAGRALARQDFREMLDRAARGEQPSVDDRLRYRRDHGYIGKLCYRAVNRLYEAAGAASIYDSHPLQRFHRDVTVAAHHVAIVWDTYAELYGRARLGLEPDGVFW